MLDFTKNIDYDKVWNTSSEVTMNLSRRIAAMQESPIRKLVPYADKAKKNGKKVYHLNIGQPDIETPEVFLKAIRNFDEAVIKYSNSRGDSALIDAIVKYYKRIGIDFTSDDILIMNGGSEAILFSLMAVADEGDNILVPEPFYTNYGGFAVPAGLTIKPITTVAATGFRLPCYDEISSLVDDKTRAILLSNPGNPTGAVYTREEVEMIAKIAQEKDLFVIADEVYREFVYDDLKYTSFGEMKHIADRVIIVDSVSKRYSACGARIGSVACKNSDFIKGVLKLCMGRLCVPTLEQVGSTALYGIDADYFEPIKAEYTKRRDIVYNALSKMEGVVCEKPRGAFYVVANMPVDDAEKFVVWMLENFDIDGETVMFAPAKKFYASAGIGKNEARLAYVLKEEDLIKAMHILDKALLAYPGRTQK